MKKIIFLHRSGNNIWVKNKFEPDNTHPNREFPAESSPLFSKYVIGVVDSAAG